jgi:hypothetical protein
MSPRQARAGVINPRQCQLVPYLTAVKQLTVVRKLIKPAPSTLELLRYPLGEEAGQGKKPHARGGVSLATADVLQG